MQLHHAMMRSLSRYQEERLQFSEYFTDDSNIITTLSISTHNLSYHGGESGRDRISSMKQQGWSRSFCFCIATTPSTSIALCIVLHLIMSTSPSSVTSAAADISTESITGKLSNINEWYYVVSKSKVLGTGHFGSVRQCTDRITGERYAVKSISKNNPGLKWGVICNYTITRYEAR